MNGECVCVCVWGGGGGGGEHVSRNVIFDFTYDAGFQVAFRPVMLGLTGQEDQTSTRPIGTTECS